MYVPGCYSDTSFVKLKPFCENLTVCFIKGYLYYKNYMIKWNNNEANVKSVLFLYYNSIRKYIKLYYKCER